MYMYNIHFIYIYIYFDLKECNDLLKMYINILFKTTF